MRRGSKAILRVAAAVLVSLVLATPATAAPLRPPGAQATAAAAQEGGQTGQIVDFAFEPTTYTAGVGETITWTNGASQPHTVTDRGGTFDTGPILPGGTGSVTFETPGTYFFFCRINPGSMNGVVVVEAAEPSPVNRVQATDGEHLEGEELAFTPAELTAPAGSTIQFANVGGLPHTMTADDGSFESGRVEPGDEGGRFAGSTVEFTLPDQPGQITFRCSVHPEAMQGVITIVDPGGGGGGGGEQPAPPAEGNPSPTEAEIQMADFSFEPVEVTVAPGATVTWTNAGQAPHTATFDEIELDTGQVEAGAQGVLTAPAEPGSYTYKCSLHPGQMQAVLTVAANLPGDPGGAEAAPAPGGDGGGDDGGGSRTLTLFVLVTAVLGAFAAGTGLTAFLRSRSRGSEG